jgi:hypothetical protein
VEPDRLAELALLVRAQEVARQDAERRITALVSAAVRDFTSWYSTALISAWTKSLVSRVEPVQRVLARSTDAYLARVGTLTTGRSVRPVGAVDVSTLRQGVTHAGAYGRVADAYRYQESLLTRPGVEADRLIPPQEAALARAEAVADADAMLVPRAQAQKTFVRQPKVTGYRRMIHPELSAGGVCGLCVAASDRLYGPTELMPIHHLCKCIPLPVYDGKDPGSTLNRQDLNKLYKDAGGSTSDVELKRTRYKVDEHGELGPVLLPASARDPESRRRSRKQPTASAAVELTPERARVVLEGQRKALAKAEELATADPKKWGQYLSQVQARVADLEKTAGS